MTNITRMRNLSGYWTKESAPKQNGSREATMWISDSRFDPRTKRIMTTGAIDNLVKGAAGQAVQK